MIYFDDIIKEYQRNKPQTLDHSNRILIIGGSGSIWKKTYHLI